MALRLVKGKPSAGGMRGAARPQAAILLVDGKGKVLAETGWETLSVDSVPRSFGPGAAPADAIAHGIAEAVTEAIERKGPAVRRAEVTLEKIRVYAIIAAPLPGAAATRLAVTVAEVDAPLASAAEGRVIRQLGHDLRTPLTSISGAIELLNSGRLGGLQPQQERVLGLMEKGAEALLRLIDEATAPYRKDRDLVAALGLDDDAGEDDEGSLPDDDSESDAR